MWDAIRGALCWIELNAKSAGASQTAQLPRIEFRFLRHHFTVMWKTHKQRMCKPLEFLTILTGVFACCCNLSDGCSVLLFLQPVSEMLMCNDHSTNATQSPSTLHLVNAAKEQLWCT
jgi:hypothetical protein